MSEVAVEGSEYWTHENQTSELLGRLLETIKEAADVLKTDEEWLLECVDAGRQTQGEKESWRSLVGLIEESCEAIPVKEELILAHGPKIKPDADAAELLRICKDILEQGRWRWFPLRRSG